MMENKQRTGRHTKVKEPDLSTSFPYILFSFGNEKQVNGTYTDPN